MPIVHVPPLFDGCASVRLTGDRKDGPKRLKTDLLVNFGEKWNASDHNCIKLISLSSIKWGEMERQRESLSTVDDTSTGGTVHAKYHFHWHYLFTEEIWCPVWASADWRAPVTQPFNPNTYIGVTHLEHGCYGRHEKGHQILNTACSGHI